MIVLRFLRWLWYLSLQIAAGSLRVVVLAVTGRRSPAIVEYRSRAASELELALFTSAITITPGTLVLGVCGTPGGEEVSVFVHSLFDNERSSVEEGLAELEWYLLRALRRDGVVEERS
ncbi:sodium:proton antiporter [Arachnia propionica]|uniref:Sodium:proton antiporter n=1 Tax=Arachnia propionica TaxID=1750 RepID=A0A3P1TCI1_9ACTN|nr:Na+/H+ antiporter subunit E [Arachnia propionica]MDO5082000.1 Na+/H+ antiporter subunit E [Arachnia propionica]RRD07157.1 sodium:proton antiporter [Arachnia propionica]